MVPAMNVRMWEHEATKRNVARLRADGVTVVEPEVGPMACGEFGPGRLPDVPVIVREIETMLAPQTKRLEGVHVLLTAGPTREPLDPVRYISNHSSGKQGYAIAAALAEEGARVTLVSGPVSIAPPPGINLVKVETAREMLKACEDALPADVFVSVAAVADWRPVKTAPQKLKLKGKGAAPSIELAENPDILRTLSHKRKQRPRLVVGFAAETQDVVKLAVEKRARKGCDWIVANDVSGDVMGGAENEVYLITAEGTEHWPRLAKEDVGRRLAARIAEALAHGEGSARLAAE
jgi:phosphopantothenoylcysteine decarboxylase/phosphopantothenate--cysteine ligase